MFFLQQTVVTSGRGCGTKFCAFSRLNGGLFLQVVVVVGVGDGIFTYKSTRAKITVLHTTNISFFRDNYYK